ncbi:polymorphic toxin-type HINT domain-containing protein [Streptomyces tsukubensis]|uniref:polymorphic toxin-type HINT domain-containing protein n=1 Tax=Streptomyces tsukubensis TaxID=83656 RepID=UPI00344E3BD5
MKRRMASRASGPEALRRFTARRRILRGFLSTGLLAGLLSAVPAPAAAEAGAGPAVSGQRGQVVALWESGGPGLKEAAEQALLGGDDAIRAFLDEAPVIQHDDNLVDTARLAMSGGPEVRAAAKQALRTSPAELEQFLLDGFEVPLDDDQKIEIARIVTIGDPVVQDAGKIALRGTAEDRELFLRSGQYEARQDDNKISVARMTNTGGPNVRAAAKVALRGTPDDIVEFIEVGQFTARARDREHASIAELTEQAKAAGTEAANATKKAEESSRKAIEASELAKEAAAKAATETQAAKNDAGRAAVKATQAADAARAAAQATQEAIGSANAANRAAHRAALAAAQTSAAASAAADAANKAYLSAIATAGNAALAGETLKMAAEARAAANLATTSVLAAAEAGKASAAAAVASSAAKKASTNALAAADSADEANAHAAAAGVHSTEARQAAAEARRHAAAADRAADRSAALARRAADAAYEARDYAASAAAHANKAADYAEDAARQAGNSATYAEQAKKNAAAAKAAADTASAAVAKAKEIFNLARETEHADLETRTDAAVERARSMKAVSQEGVSSLAGTQVQALSLNDTATTLAQQAARSDVDVQGTAAEGRRLAMQAMKLLGPWHKEAAARALSGTDQDVLDYLRTRWKEAGDNDRRQQAVDLSSQSPRAAVREAAAGVLAGTAEQIKEFVADGQYTVALDDMKVEVARLTNTGGPQVAQAAKAVLANGTPKELAVFLQAGQYAERVTDQQVEAARLTNTGGPEVRAAAKAALAGPPELLHEFIITGQHMAQRKDDLTANHVHQMERLLAEGSLIAATAQYNRWKAAEAAAEAEKAKTEAAAAAGAAVKSSEEAKRHASSAKASADAATKSASAAAQSATTARNAANRASQDADAAENSAAEAAFSAFYAYQSAREASSSADKARELALDAGKSTADADKEAGAAWLAALDLREKEEAAARKIEAEFRKQEQEAKPKRVCVPHPSRDTMAPIWDCAMSPEDSVIEVWDGDPALREVVWTVTPLNDIKACAQNPSVLACAVATAGLIPWARLKALAKIDNAIDALKARRALTRSIGCLTKRPKAHSFPAGTPVLMADGTGRPIEQVKVGDQVTATDPDTGETGSRTVTRTIHTPDDRDFTDVTLTDGSTLTSTRNHPYWSENARAWKQAGALRAGDTLRTPNNSAAAIAATRNWQGLKDAYDLTVDDLHTYYVSTGTTNVLVHNTNEDYICDNVVQDAFDSLPKPRAGTHTAYGYAFNEKKEPIWPGKFISSEETGIDDEINKFLLPIFDKTQGKIPFSSHVEIKMAWAMANNSDRPAVAHLVINKNYVCPRPGEKVGCKQLVPKILYKGQVLYVYNPQMDEVVKLEGKRVREKE